MIRITANWIHLQMHKFLLLFRIHFSQMKISTIDESIVRDSCSDNLLCQTDAKLQIDYYRPISNEIFVLTWISVAGKWWSTVVFVFDAFCIMMNVVPFNWVPLQLNIQPKEKKKSCNLCLNAAIYRVSEKKNTYKINKWRPTNYFLRKTVWNVFSFSQRQTK